MKLYEIKEAMIETLDIFLESDREEIDKEFYEETMTYLKSELSCKSSNIIKYICNLDSEVLSIKNEIDRLTKAKKARERKLESLKSYLINTLHILDKSKIETDIGTYGLRKSVALKVFDLNQIPEEYLKVKKEVSVDKRALTTAIREGYEIKGAILEERYSLHIK